MSKCKDSLWRKCLQIYSKRTLPYTHLQILVDKQLKKQFFCELSENFETAIVIKASFCVSAVFSRSHTLTLLVSIKNKVLLLIFKINEIKNSNINPYQANFSYRFFASMCSQSTLWNNVMHSVTCIKMMLRCRPTYPVYLRSKCLIQCLK